MYHVPVLSYRFPIIIDMFPTDMFRSRYYVFLSAFPVPVPGKKKNRNKNGLGVFPTDFNPNKTFCMIKSSEEFFFLAEKTGVIIRRK